MSYEIAIKFDNREVGEEISLPIGIAKPLLDKGIIVEQEKQVRQTKTKKKDEK